MSKTVKVTKAGLAKLKTELEERLEKKEYLRSRIEEARSAGDLRENDGYSLALDENESNEIEINKLQKQIDNAVIVKESGSSSVNIGNDVTLKNDAGQETIYAIVGDNESDPINNMISANSPIGTAVMGKKVGESFTVKLPKGDTEFTVTNIE